MVRFHVAQRTCSLTTISVVKWGEELATGRVPVPITEAAQVERQGACTLTYGQRRGEAVDKSHTRLWAEKTMQTDCLNYR